MLYKKLVNIFDRKTKNERDILPQKCPPPKFSRFLVILSYYLYYVEHFKIKVIENRIFDKNYVCRFFVRPTVTEIIENKIAPLFQDGGKAS